MKKLTWEEVESLTKNLANKIRESEFRPDYIIGITTGGLFPLGLVAKELKVKNILTATARSNNDNVHKEEVEILYIPQINLTNKNVLLIDDVTERGLTLYEVANAIKKTCKPKVLKTATIAMDINKCKHSPDYYAIKQETDWVVFPWEKEKFGPYAVGKRE